MDSRGNIMSPNLIGYMASQLLPGKEDWFETTVNWDCNIGYQSSKPCMGLSRLSSHKCHLSHCVIFAISGTSVWNTKIDSWERKFWNFALIRKLACNKSVWEKANEKCAANLNYLGKFITYQMQKHPSNTLILFDYTGNVSVWYVSSWSHIWFLISFL